MNSKMHLNKDQIVRYTYHMLSDTQREVIDKHLAECPVCRARIAECKNNQHEIERTLKAEINTSTPPVGMSFSQIAPRLKQQQSYWQRFSAVTPLIAASLGLIIALIGVWHNLINSNLILVDHGKSTSASLPALACFFFMFVSMNQYDRSFSIRPRFIFTVLLSIILWLGSSILGLLNVIVIRDLTIAAVIFSGGNPETASVVSILTIIIAAMVLIGVMIGGAEFHYKHLGQPSSWKLFVWTIAIQLLIMILPYIIL